MTILQLVSGEARSVGEIASHLDITGQAVSRHLTDPAAMVRWMGQHATLEPVEGGAFEVDINGVPVRGQYLEVDPPHRVVVSWGVAGHAEMPPGATRVEFTLSPTSGGTRLHLVHRDLPASQTEMHGTGWDHFFSRLTMSVTGADPGPDPWLMPASGS